MRRKILYIVWMMVLFSGVLFGCNDMKETKEQAVHENEKAQVGGQQVQIDILQYKVEIHDTLQQAIDEYMEQHPNVKINLETVGGEESAGVVYASKATDGKMPDIFNCIGPAECEEYKDYLEDLSDQPWIQHAYDGVLDLDTIDGKVYGMPVSVEAFGLIYNKAIFEAAEIDIDNLTSYDALNDAFARLQEKIDKGDLKEQFPNLKNVTAVQGAEKWVLGDHAVNVALSPEFKEDVFEAAQAKSVKFKFRQAYQDYLELQLKYSLNAKAYDGAISIDYNTAVSQLLAHEEIAVLQQGNWIYGDVNKENKRVAENLAFLPVPIKGYKEDSIVTLVGNYWCINKQSDSTKKKVAKDFLNWLYQSDEGKDIVVNKFGFIPVFDNYGDLMPKDNLSQSCLSYINRGKTIQAVFKGTPGAKWTQNVFGLKVQQFLQGELTWNQVFEQSAKEWENMRRK